ncbi:Cytochrome P450 107B1 [Actinomadura rubteroloni]|uniref:Cytochrome P450 107B1 n=1 Tax=Actinomadura rubteroloni TaxID=1926885 RepID=A0A2P4UEZ2_9ACTN|nr:cytochrome P450 [Actinomadura rubteroloni]POM23623.1 Cytochrome P450 107B1 [Actinomadura rubteroloni]
MTETPDPIAALGADFTDDPYPAYGFLRAADPVHESAAGFWLLSSYRDVSAVLRAGLSSNPRNVTHGAVLGQYERLGGTGAMFARTMLEHDAPDHTRLRSLVTKVFTRRAVAALETRVTELVDAALDRVADAGRADLVDALAFPLPFAVISEMLGLPPDSSDRVRELSGLLVRSQEPVFDPAVLDSVARAGDAMVALVRELIAAKRRDPGDDLLTALIAAEQDGARLTDDELVAQVVLLYIAGHETTVNLIAGGTVALLRNPGQLAALRANPGLTGNAVEELLRYDSPVQQTRRITTAPYTVRGREIPPGTFVIACVGSANRDEEFWGPDADQLRLDRPDARRHVSFGAGPHHCLGAALARLEGRVAFERLVRRFPRLEFDGDVVWNGRVNLRGPAELPVRV